MNTSPVTYARRRPDGQPVRHRESATAAIETADANGASACTCNRRSRAKHHYAWEHAEQQTHGTYTAYMRVIAEHHCHLTPMELRVCALIKSMKFSWQIGQMLNVTEKTVERYRVRIRRKLELGKRNLQCYLAEL